MRALIEPKAGYAICGIDYGSQEFLIAALVAKDKNMIEAYKSGDVYLYFAKLAGAVPWDGLKKDYKQERDVFKSTTLGISYSMGSAALARKLTDDTGKPHTQKDAQNLIDKFMSAYPDYANWIEAIRFDYDRRRFHKLPDGWIIFGDNSNKRSVSNVPIQGFGSCILRKAIQLAQDRRLKIIFPLHDAAYHEYPSIKLEDVDTFAECMREAFIFYFDDKEGANLIRLDINIWSTDYEDGDFITPGGLEGKMQKIYIDERAAKEYEKFKKYMEA
jgi:DNA polymerase-1